jgi:hypothetical protein
VGKLKGSDPSKACYCWREERLVVTVATISRERARSIAKILLHPFKNMDHFCVSLLRSVTDIIESQLQLTISMNYKANLTIRRHFSLVTTSPATEKIQLQPNLQLKKSQL